MERTGVITFLGGPLTLVGPEIKVGDKAPDFTVLDNGLGAKTLDGLRRQDRRPQRHPVARHAGLRRAAPQVQRGGGRRSATTSSS